MTLLETVTSTRETRPPRMLLIGTEKVGKSTFASKMTQPICIPVIREEGIDDIDVPAFPAIETVNRLREILLALSDPETSHDYKTLIIDSVSALQPLVAVHAMEQEGVDSEAKLGGGYGRQWDTQLVIWGKILEALDRLRNNFGMAACLIGHATVNQFDDPLVGASYSRYDIDLPPKVRSLLYRWVDVILFADWRVYTSTEDAGFNKEKTRGLGDGTRVLFTQKRPNHPGGGRGIYGRLPYEMELDAELFQKHVTSLLPEKRKPKNGRKQRTRT
jgi:hypothetical protein